MISSFVRAHLMNLYFILPFHQMQTNKQTNTTTKKSLALPTASICVDIFMVKNQQNARKKQQRLYVYIFKVNLNYKPSAIFMHSNNNGEKMEPDYELCINMWIFVSHCSTANLMEKSTLFCSSHLKWQQTPKISSQFSWIFRHFLRSSVSFR